MMLAKRTDPFPDAVDGVELVAEVGRGAHSVVYEGRCRDQRVAVKVSYLSGSGSTDLDEVARRLQREAAMLARVPSAGLARTLEVGVTLQGRPCLIMEYVDARTLASRLGDGPMSEAEVVDFGVRIAETLSAVHARCIVHRDIKPANVLLPKAPGIPKLIDFGLAMDAASTDEGRAREVVGTFAYSSPEQTGMLRRAVDGRSDLYSLGIVLFECATGNLPFQADDVPTLLQMHATRVAPLVRQLRSTLSPGLERIIGKLVAKDPDDRYQSAHGLVFDLQRLSRRALAEDAVLDVRRAPPWYAQGRGIVGRTAELDDLKRLQAQAAAGVGRCAAVIAPAGHGKTRLCQALALYTEQSGGVVLWARCIQDQQAPLAALGEAVGQALTHLSGQESDQGTLRADIEEAAGDYAPYLRRLFPELLPWLSEASTDLDPHTEQDTLCEAAAQFVTRLAGRRAPVLLLLDDAQWADTATRKVMERIRQRLDDVGLFVVWATRHADATSELLRPTLTVELSPLGATAVEAMIANRLFAEQIDPSIAAQIATRSQGVPRAVDEYVKAMVDAGALSPHWGSWRLDGERLKAMALPEDLDRLVIRRALTLPDAQRKVLRTASLVGRRFHLDVLQSASGADPNGVQEAVVASHHAGLIEALPGGAYGFVHDGARDALLGEVAPDERPLLHRAIAQAEEARLGLDPDALLRAARHHFLGHDASIAEHAYALSLRAGSQAQLGLANQEALDLFGNAETLAELYGLKVEYELYRGLAEAHLQLGQLSRSLELYDRAIKHCADPITRSLMHSRCCEVHAWIGVGSEAMRPHLFAAWELLGMRFPQGALWQLLGALWWALVGALTERTGLWFGRDAQKPLAEARWKAVHCGATYAYARVDIPLHLNMISRQLNAGQMAGRSRLLVDAWGASAAALDSFHLPARWADHFYNKGYALADALGDKVARAKVRFWQGVGLNQRGLPLEAAEVLEEVLLRNGQLLPLEVQITGAMELGLNRSARGFAMETLAFAQALTGRSLGAEDRRSNGLTQVVVSCNIILGDMKETWRICDENWATLPPEAAANPFIMFADASFRLTILLESDDKGNLEEVLQKAERLAPPAALIPWHFGGYFIQRGYARHILWQGASQQERPARLLQMRKAVKDAQIIARHPLHRPQATLLQAMLALAEGKMAEGERLAAQAEQLACGLDHPVAELEALVLRARLLREARRFGPSERAARAALAIAEEGGWQLRAQRVRTEFGTRSTSSATGSETRAADRTRGLRTSSTLHAAHGHRALMEVSLATAQVLDPEAQAVVALDKLIALLGAERGILFGWDEKEGLKFEVGRDASGESLPSDAGIAWSLVQRVAQTRLPIVLAGTEEGKALGSESVVAHELRSMLCAPLVLQDRLMGVIYLDSRLAKSVFSEDDLDILLAIANQILIARETALSAQRAMLTHELQRDLQTSAVVQSLLLPSSSEASSSHFDLAALFRPMGHSGGDFWQYDISEDGTLRVWIGDVTGHGVGAAMVGAAVAGCYRSLRDARYGLTTEDILGEIHRAMREICRGAYGLPLGVLELSAQGHARYVSAAAPPLLIWDPKSGVSVKQCGGTPLGSESHVVKTVSFPILPGQRFLVLSDGVLEMTQENGKQLGLRRLRELFVAGTDENAGTTRDRLGRELDALRGSAKLSDDLTLVAVSARA